MVKITTPFLSAIVPEVPPPLAGVAVAVFLPVAFSNPRIAPLVPRLPTMTMLGLMQGVEKAMRAAGA